jgi:hypothetical protein
MSGLFMRALLYFSVIWLALSSLPASGADNDQSTEPTGFVMAADEAQGDQANKASHNFSWEVRPSLQSVSVDGNEEMYRHILNLNETGAQLYQLHFLIKKPKGWYDEFRLDFANTGESDFNSLQMTLRHRGRYKIKTDYRERKDFALGQAGHDLKRKTAKAEIAIFPINNLRLDFGFKRQEIEGQDNTIYHQSLNTWPLSGDSDRSFDDIYGAASFKLGPLNIDVEHGRNSFDQMEVFSLIDGTEEGNQPGGGTLLAFEAWRPVDGSGDNTQVNLHFPGNVVDVQLHYSFGSDETSSNAQRELDGTTTSGNPQQKISVWNTNADRDWQNAKLVGRWKVHRSTLLKLRAWQRETEDHGTSVEERTTVTMGVPLQIISEKERRMQFDEIGAGLAFDFNFAKHWGIEFGGDMLERDYDLDWQSSLDPRQETVNQSGTRYFGEVTFRNGRWDTRARYERGELDEAYTDRSPLSSEEIELEARYYGRGGWYTGIQAESGSSENDQPWMGLSPVFGTERQWVAALAGYSGKKWSLNAQIALFDMESRSITLFSDDDELLPQFLFYDLEHYSDHLDANVKFSERWSGQITGDYLKVDSGYPLETLRVQPAVHVLLNRWSKLSLGGYYYDYNDKINPQQNFKAQGVIFGASFFSKNRSKR